MLQCMQADLTSLTLSDAVGRWSIEIHEEEKATSSWILLHPLLESHRGCSTRGKEQMSPGNSKRLKDISRGDCPNRPYSRHHPMVSRDQMSACRADSTLGREDGGGP